MAAIRRKHGSIAVACCASVLFCDTGEYSGWKTVSLPEGKKEDENEEKEKLNEKAGNKVLALVFSSSGQYLAACDDQKQLHVYKTGQEWTLVSSRSVVRRGKSLVFTKNEEKILMADKSGDVYSFSVSEPDRPGELTHGHLSMVLDMVLASDDQYVITCDRDEKIRVCNYPNSYNIYSFCLGHTEFVTSLIWVEENSILLSGSGDLTIRGWSTEGKQLTCIQTGALTSTDQQVDIELRPALQKLTYCAKHRLLAVGFYGYQNIEVYQLSMGGTSSPSLSLVQTITLTVDPWDICFDESGYLWLVQPIEGTTLQLYKTVAEGAAVKLQEVIDGDDKLLRIQKELNSKWDVLKGCLETKSIVPTLWKQRIDNMADYLKKKEERLAGTKSGGDNSNVDSPPPPEKVPKTS